MKTIIAGGRHMHLSTQDCILLDSLDITEVVSGGARGIDQSGEAWAMRKGIPVKIFPANWTKHKLAAGPIRNREMADYADRLVAFWDGKSRGTKNMIDTARKLQLEVIVVEEGQVTHEKYPR